MKQQCSTEGFKLQRGQTLFFLKEQIKGTSMKET